MPCEKPLAGNVGRAMHGPSAVGWNTERGDPSMARAEEMNFSLPDSAEVWGVKVRGVQLLARDGLCLVPELDVPRAQVHVHETQPSLSR